MENKDNYKKKANIDFSSLAGAKLPPHSIEAERAVLGAMLIDRNAISKVAPILEVNSFYDERHKKIYASILNLFDKQVNVDTITLCQDLTSNGQLELVGGSFYIIELVNETPTAANVEYHARIIQEKFLKRNLIEAAGQILVNSYDETVDALEEIDRAEADIFQIAEKRIVKSYSTFYNLARETMDVIQKLHERDQPGLTGVPTGFNELDNLLGGFQKSDFIIIAARPSMGKTALALSIARNIAVAFKKPIAFFSVEMAAVQLVIRILSSEAKINQQKIRTGNISQEDMNRIVGTLGRIANAPLIIDDSPTLSIMELRAKCRRLKVEHKIEAVMIDYLQLIHSAKAESREREISIISRSLKQLAKELDIPIIALAQLNRSVEARPDKRPMLSDLRESGSIEQDADVVMFIHRPEYYGIQFYDDDAKTPTAGTAEIIIGKQRNGPVGTRRLAYLKDFARFENLELQYEEPEYFKAEQNQDLADFEDEPF